MTVAAEEIAGSGGQGVLPSQALQRALACGAIRSVDGSEIAASQLQPASLDLRLGPKAYRLRCSFLPGRATVERRLGSLVMEVIDLTGRWAVLQPRVPYLIPLKEELALPPGLRGRANPKSSTGRADVFTRVITDGGVAFDDIADGYTGGLYLEVVPLSFTINVREGLSLNQLRLSKGSERLGDDELRELHARQPLLYDGSRAVPGDELPLADGLYLTLDLGTGRNASVGYRAKANAPLLDMTEVGKARHTDYWEVARAHGPGQVILEAHEFYLLMSREAVSIPPSVAAEMTAYDPTSGELRTHYAGFFDPGFGYDELSRNPGATAALEVRAHDVGFMIENGQRVCKLTFERMLEAPDTLYGAAIGSNYQGQNSVLGKHFRRQSPATAPAEPAQGALDFGAVAELSTTEI